MSAQLTDETTTLPVLKRGQKHPTPRSVTFIDQAPTPEVLSETGGDEIWITGNTAETWLDRPRLMALVADGWTVEKYLAELRTATLSRNGHTVTLRAASRWYGEERSVPLIRATHQRLYQQLRWKFEDQNRKREPWVHLWPTPTQTGLELLRGSLPFGKEYPVLPAEIRERIVRNSSQGRRELTTAKDGLNAGLDKLPGLHELDARWMYAACVRDLPTGPVEHDEYRGVSVKQFTHYAQHKPGFYVVHARVPADWKHIGLLPEWDGERTRYPWKPGSAFVSFCTGAELEIALHYGWVMSIHERIIWPERSSDPTKHWITKLRVLRAEEEGAFAAFGEQDAALVAKATRRLVLDAIGGWHSSERVEEGYIPEGQPLEYPSGAIPQRDLRYWTRSTPVVTEFTHPEWSATVWGRARARLVKFALELPPASIIALRTDAIWVSYEGALVLVDGGQPGDFRPKSALYRNSRAPRTETAFLALARKARGGEEAEDD